MTRLLEGVVEPEDPRADKIAALEREVRQLRRERDDAQIEAKRAREDAQRALAALRRQLTPLYRALQSVFGELDAAGVADAGPVGPAEAAFYRGEGRIDTDKWTLWKQRLGSGCAKVIDTLLLGDEMTVTAIAVKIGHIVDSAGPERNNRMIR
jgi:hypothetical protein